MICRKTCVIFCEFVFCLELTENNVCAIRKRRKATHNSDADTAGDDGAGDHALIQSVVVSSDYLTTAAPITAVITFARGVAAIQDNDTLTTFVIKWFRNTEN
ncbi:hypothetical protein C6501_13220 [Candidatus Poribacteria bacterium]|nr:MAG: hypothetical protein C6501_13220 [Candidatus Poribacteria bacterium]